MNVKKVPSDSEGTFYEFNYSSSGALETIMLTMIPIIRAQATEVIVILPKLRVRPPIPAIKIDETTNRFLLRFRLTV